MKKTIKTMLAFVAGLLTLSACDSDEIFEEQNPQTPGTITFTATAADDGGELTRASFDSINVIWNTGDAISVFSSGDSKNTKMTLTRGAGTTSGEFTGTCEPGSEYLAIYPYADNNRYDLGNAGKSRITYTWNGVIQQAVQGSFPKNTPMIAMATDDIDHPSANVALHFKNVCSYIKVTTDYPCRSITMRSNNASDKLVANVLDLTVTDGKPEIVTATNTSSSVMLLDKTGSNLPAGTYYIAVLPGTLSKGFTLIFTAFSGGTTYTKSTSKSVTLKRSTVLNLGTISLHNTEVETLEGDGSKENPYLIKDFDDLKLFQRWITSEKDRTWEKSYLQTADIDAQGAEMAPIGTPDHRFWGTYDGGGHTIRNLCIKGTVDYVVPTNTYTEKNRATALFGAIRGATIQNLTIENPSFHSSNVGEKLTVSPLVGVAYSGNDDYANNRCRILNCKLKGSCIVNNVSPSCSTYITFHFGFLYGGFVGCSQANMEITDCTSDMALSAYYAGELSSEFYAYAGGFVGIAFGVNENNSSDLEHDGEIRLNRCRNNGNITFIQSNRINVTGLGGFIGIVRDLMTDNDVTCYMSNCVNNGTLELQAKTFTNVYRGGLVAHHDSNGNSSNKPSFENCVNNGDFKGSCEYKKYLYGGGLIGFNYGDDTKISYCANTGVVSTQSYSFTAYHGTLNECWECRGRKMLYYYAEATNTGTKTIDEIVTHMNASSFVKNSGYFKNWKKSTFNGKDIIELNF